MTDENVTDIRLARSDRERRQNDQDHDAAVDARMDFAEALAAVFETSRLASPVDTIEAVVVALAYHAALKNIFEEAARDAVHNGMGEWADLFNDLKPQETTP